MSRQYMRLPRMGSSCEYSYIDRCRYWTFFGYQLGWHELDVGKQVCKHILSLERLLMGVLKCWIPHLRTTI